LTSFFFVFCAGGKTRQPFLPPACRTMLKGSCIVCVFCAPRSGMRNGLLTSSFSFFVQGVRLASPSSLLPAEPFSKGLVLYVCFAHLAQVCTNAFWCECLACTGLFYERLLDGRIDGNFYTLPRSCLYLLLSSLRYVCVEVITNFWSVVYFLF